MCLPFMNGGEVGIQMAAQLDARGGGLGPAVEALCPDNQVVTAYEGRAGLLLDQLVILCSRVRSVDGRLRPSPGLPLPSIGGNGGALFDRVFCPVNEVAVGHVVRAGDGIDAYGLLCNEVRVLIQ